jgi:hypothetical protein
MGLAWIPDDAGHAAAPERGRDWPGRARHRRPTLLARGGQAVAGRLGALSSADPDLGIGRSAGEHVVRRAVLPARRYWT